MGMIARKTKICRYTKADREILACLLGYLSDEDASGFCVYYRAQSLDSDPAKRCAVGSLGLTLCRLGLSWRRRTHTLPDVDEREHIVDNIANSPFGNLTRPDLVRELVWWGCRDYSLTPFEFRNNDLDVTTAIVVGGVLLITNHPYWMERYKIAMRRLRRAMGYDPKHCLDGAAQIIGGGSRSDGGRRQAAL